MSRNNENSFAISDLEDKAEYAGTTIGEYHVSVSADLCAVIVGACVFTETALFSLIFISLLPVFVPSFHPFPPTESLTRNRTTLNELHFISDANGSYQTTQEKKRSTDKRRFDRTKTGIVTVMAW